MEKLKYSHTSQINGIIKSVKSRNLCKSVVQTSYDIVKAHGGELKVESKEGISTELIIRLLIKPEL